MDVLGQVLFVHAGLIIESFELRSSGYLEQVVITDVVFSQKGNVVRSPIFLGVSLGHAAGGNVHLGTDDGLYPLFLSCLVKLNGSIHSSMVGDRQGWHAKLLGPVNQMSHPSQAIEQGVFAMHVEVNKGGHETLLSDAAYIILQNSFCL